MHSEVAGSTTVNQLFLYGFLDLCLHQGRALCQFQIRPQHWVASYKAQR